MSEILLGAELTLRSLNRRMPKEQLNLLQFAAGRELERLRGTYWLIGGTDLKVYCSGHHKRRCCPWRLTGLLVGRVWYWTVQRTLWV